MPNTARFVVYGLVDPRSGQLRYIGKTYNAEKRFKDHLRVSTLEKERSHKARWILSLIKLGLKPELFIIEECETDAASLAAECHHIAYFKSIGCNLTNLTIGGQGVVGHRCSTESRRLMSRKRKELFKDPEFRRRHLEITRIAHSKPEFRAKLGKSIRAAHQRPDVKEKYLKAAKECQNRPGVSDIKSQNNKRWWAVPQNKYRMVEAALECQNRPEVKKAKSERATKQFASLEARAQHSRIRGGRPFCDELGNIYQTQYEAADKLKLNVGKVNNVLHGKRKSTGGHVFRFIEDVAA